MNQSSKFQRWIRPALYGLMVAASLAVSRAQTYTNIVVAQFDTSSDPFNTLFEWWGLTTFNTSWDGTQNNPTTLAANTAGSGALLCNSDWTGTSATNNSPDQPQLMIWNAFCGQEWNASETINCWYYDLNFDLMIDPSSATTANGDYGHIQAGLVPPGWGSQIAIWDDPAFTSNGWAHIHAYIDPTIPGVNSVAGFYLYWPWQTDANNNGALHGPQKFWVDNVIFSTNLTKPIKPPTMTLAPVKVTPGLNIQTSASAGEYDRDGIATASGNYSWVGAGSSPVTYSLTIGKYPGTSFPNFQTQIFLASGPNDSLPGTEASPDWNEPNCIFLQIQNNADGSASARFMWKTNDANANDQFWTPPPLGTLYDPAGVLGTWSVSMVNDTNVTLTSPSGLSTNFFFPDDMALQTYFPQGAVVAYFGGQPNATANIGQGIVLSEVKITGPPAQIVPIDDHFTEAALDPTVWAIRESQSTAVSLIQNNIHWSLSWTLPDLNFTLQSAPSVLGPWTDATIASNAVQSGTSKSLFVPDSALPSQTSSFFRMVKPVATQLQVLMPGETAAPGTATGKTGTPTAAPAGTAFNVIVNAVDSKWNVIPYVSDTVSLTSSDSMATLPANMALANGTATFNNVAFGQTGTWTITATDLSSSSVAPGTSSTATAQ